jgi:hypothetical protein
VEILSGIVDAIAAFFAGFAGHVVAHDFCEVTPMVCKKLIQAAALRLPERIRDRYLQEWEADLSDQPGALAKIKWALGCLLCAHRMRRAELIEHRRHLLFVVVLEDGNRLELDYATATMFLRFMDIFAWAGWMPRTFRASRPMRAVFWVHCMSSAIWLIRRYSVPDMVKVDILIDSIGTRWEVTTMKDGNPIGEPRVIDSLRASK